MKLCACHKTITVNLMASFTRQTYRSTIRKSSPPCCRQPSLIIPGFLLTWKTPGILC